MCNKDSFRVSSQQFPAQAPRLPLLLMVMQQPWVPLIIVAPGVAQWFMAPMNHTSWVSLLLDAFGVFLGTTYMFQTGPQSRKSTGAQVASVPRRLPPSAIGQRRRVGATEYALIVAFAAIYYIADVLQLGWPIATNWAALVMCGVFAAIFDKDWTLRTSRGGVFALVFMIALAVAPPYVFSSRTNQLIFSPLFFVMCAMLSVGVGLSILAQRQKWRLEYERNYLEAAMAESRLSKEIARELHDSVAHEVAGISVLAQAARILQQSGTSTPESMEQALESIETSSKRALDSIRKTVQSFNEGRGADFSPTPTSYRTVVELIREFESTHTLQVSADSGNAAAGAHAGRDASASPPAKSQHVIVDISEETDALASANSCSPVAGYSLPDSVCTTLYRIAAEALTNIHKHAPGAYVYICLRVAHCPPGQSEQCDSALHDAPLKHPYYRINCDRFVEEHPSLCDPVPYPRIELFIYNSGSDKALRERHFIGHGSGMGHKNIVMRAKALDGAAYVGSYSARLATPHVKNQEQKGWLVFCTLPMEK